MNDTDIEHLEGVLRHIGNVRENCELLGKRLIDNDEEALGIQLIGLGLIHDHSKIRNSVEFKFIRGELKGTPEFDAAATSHITSNPHHPEYWSGIENMPDIYLAEMVCDWAARSSEFGNDLRDWIKDKATKKYEFSTCGATYKAIKKYVDLLLDPAFK